MSRNRGEVNAAPQVCANLFEATDFFGLRMTKQIRVPGRAATTLPIFLAIVPPRRFFVLVVASAILFRSRMLTLIAAAWTPAHADASRRKSTYKCIEIFFQLRVRVARASGAEIKPGALQMRGDAAAGVGKLSVVGLVWASGDTFLANG